MNADPELLLRDFVRGKSDRSELRALEIPIDPHRMAS